MEITLMSLTQKLLSIALIFQTIELILIKKTYLQDGIWNSQIIEKDIWVLKSLFQPNAFTGILWLRLILSGVLFLNAPWVVIAILFLLTLLINFRWRGSFNGASDSMTLILLLGILPYSYFQNTISLKWGFYYIAVHAVISYFLAGVIKIKKSNWRSGLALRGFLSNSLYQPNKLSRFLLQDSNFLLVLSWGVILFEIVFPFALLKPEWCTLFLGIGILFHFVNFYFLGLNRFFWIWIATYPAIYYLSSAQIF